MKEYFEKFIENISLTKKQRDDAITKYKGICKCLNEEFYDSEYSDSIKFLFGSYKKKTTISHPNKDVDVIFKIPKATFERYQSQENGPSNLLTRIKNTLKDKYSTTDKIKNWTKVVLIDFQSFKVEVLPALEQENGKFTIPNSGNWEDWIIDFDPKKEINDFFNSNNSNDKLTRKLIKMIKKWKLEKSAINIKTYILDTYVIDFLSNYTFTDYPNLIADFFNYLHAIENQTYTETAMNQSKKALDYYNSNKIDSSIEEYKKLFGNLFPKNISKSFSNIQYSVAPNEEFIENIFNVWINSQYFVKINCEVSQDGWRPTLLNKISFLAKSKKLRFFIENHNINEPFNVKRKVRNFGREAESKNDLRGEISNDNGKREKKENTKYRGEHFVECYIIKNDICIAKDKIIVPIEK